MIFHAAAWLAAHPAAGIPVVIVAYAAFLAAKPYRECRWCKHGRLRDWTFRGGRCWRCRGTRLNRRLGAWHVHKVLLSVRQAIEEWRYRDG